MIKLPIVVSEGGDVMIFESLSDAEHYLESIDVLQNRYRGYDSNGKLLRFVAAAPLCGEQIMSNGPVRINVAESIPSHGVELKKTLVEVLFRLNQGAEADLLNLPLEALLQKSVSSLGYTR